jgi:leader peptidase (prepilin peptidase)/N-methyltransferase
VYAAIVWSILIVIFVYDLKHKIIPDGLVFLFIGLGFLALIARVLLMHAGLPGLTSADTYTLVLDFLAGPILFLPFFLMWYLSGGRWLGFGDAKLAIGIGWFLGLWQGIAAIVFSFWAGALISILLLLWQHVGRKLMNRTGLSGRGKYLTMKSEIPFAPFLIIGMALVFFFGLTLPGLALFLTY